MPNLTNDENWAARERLRRIEFLLWWRGWVGRQDLVESFGISPAQASGDLQRYAGINAGAMMYHTSRKRYEAMAGMVCHYHVPSWEEAVATLLGGVAPLRGTQDGGGRADVVMMPQRACDPLVARRVMIALQEGRWLEVRYASLSGGVHAWRRIVPARVAWDGHRWHVRAWCENNSAWRDFVLGRMSKANWPIEGAVDVPVDRDWETRVTVRLKINPLLDHEQREALRMDYGLAGEVLELKVREAMKSYVLANHLIEESYRELPRHFVIEP